MVSLLLVAALFDVKGLVQLWWSDINRKIVKFSVVMCWPLRTPINPAHTIGGDGVWGVSCGSNGCRWSTTFVLTCRMGALLLMTVKIDHGGELFWWIVAYFLSQGTARTAIWAS